METLQHFLALLNPAWLQCAVMVGGKLKRDTVAFVQDQQRHSAL